MTACDGQARLVPQKPETNASLGDEMHEPIDDQARNDTASTSPTPCNCVCGEPGDGEAGQTDRAINYYPVYFDINGEPALDEG